jgi:hypothetical protein
MTEEQIVKFMLDSINQDNRDMCERGGMSPDEIDSSIEQSQPSLAYIVQNLYTKMKEENLIA